MARLDKTLADYIGIAVSPVLIMAMVGSLVFFLLEVFYQGEYEARLQVILALFVMAIVLIGRISIEMGTEQATLYAGPLALVTALALFRLVEGGWIFNVALLGLVWWSAHKLTWDCTLIDETEDASGEGLLQSTGLDRLVEKGKTPPTPAAEGAAETPPEEPKPAKPDKRKPHAPGVWIVYFSLAALPLFGLGEVFLRNQPLLKHHAFFLLFIYVASGLGLLLTTSFLGLRRYLRQRQLEMPVTMAGSWIGFGAVLVVALLVVTALLPRPGTEQSAFQSPIVLRSPERKASPWALGKDGAKGPGKPGAQKPAGPKPSEAQPGGKSSSPQQGSGGSQPGNSGSPSQQSGGKQSGGQQSNEKQAAGQQQSNSDKSSQSQSDSQQQNRDGNSSTDQSSSETKETGGKEPSQQGGGQKSSDADRKRGSPPPSKNQKDETPQGSSGGEERSSQQDAKQEDRDNSGDSQSQSASDSSSESSSSWSISEWSPALSNEWLMASFRWLLYLVLGVVGAVWLWRSRREVVAFFQGILQALHDLWASLFRGRKREKEAAVVEETKPAPPKPFAAFADPFLTGTAARLAPEELVRYTFEALEAWAREHGCTRLADQTASEFARCVAGHTPTLAKSVRRLAELYNQAAYAPGTLKAAEVAPLRQLWQLMGANAPITPPSTG